MDVNPKKFEIGKQFGCVTMLLLNLSAASWILDMIRDLLLQGRVFTFPFLFNSGLAINAGKMFGVTDFVDAGKSGDKSPGQVDISIANH